MAETSYPGIQRVASDLYRGLDDSEIEAFVAEQFPGATAEDVENFMKTLQKFGKTAAPLAQKALPGVIQGASTGMVAGPWGALAGGLAGGAASLLAGGSSGARPSGARPPAARPATAPVQPSRPAPPQGPGVAAAPPASTPAAASLVSSPAISPAARPPAAPDSDAVVLAAARLILLISRPEVQRALLALLLGPAGRSSLPVGGRQVPVEAFAETLAELAAELSDAAAGPGTDRVQELIADSARGTEVDVTNPAQRALALLFELVSEEMSEPGAERLQVPANLVLERSSTDDDIDPLEDYERWTEDL